jgi:phage terminase Nu1 subunit (DNA packaging protein)
MKDEDDDWLNGGPAEDGEAFDSLNGIVVSKSRLATLTGYSMATIDRSFANGAPVLAKGTRKSGWKINSAAWIQWYVAHKVQELTDDPDRLDFDTAKAARMAADARLKEMQVARLEGQTLTIDELVALYTQESSDIRNQLMAIPGRLAIQIAAESDASKVQLMIEDEVNTALAMLTGDRRDTWTGETDAEREVREDAEADEFDSSAN